MNSKVTNIVIAGLGGQGVLMASDILAEVALASGLDVKKSEIHGMSQRGGSVTGDVRFGAAVHSPMVPEGEADYLLVLEPTQVPVNLSMLRPGGVLLDSGRLEGHALRNKKSVNVALLGALSRHLDFSEDAWIRAIRASLPEKLHDVNLEAFAMGRAL